MKDIGAEVFLEIMPSVYKAALQGCPVSDPSLTSCGYLKVRERCSIYAENIHIVFHNDLC